MPITVLSEGGITISSNTEYSMVARSNGVSANTTAGVYQCFIDVSDLVAGDQLEIKIYEKAMTANTQRLIYSSVLTGAQAEPMWVSPSLILTRGWDMTANSQLGGNIVLAFSVRQVA